MSGTLQVGAEQRRLALACADVGFFELDADARMISFDGRAGELVGIRVEGAVALDDYLAVVDPGDRGRVAERFARAVAAHGDAYHDEFRTRSRRWLAADGRAVHDSLQRRVVLVGLLCDVTLRKTTEDARTRLVDEMARSLRFNDMLVGMVAHDLSSPLEAVLAAAGAVAGQVPDPIVQRGIASIAENAGRMTRIVEQLLDLTHARLDGQVPLRVRPSDVSIIVRQIAAELMAAHPGTVIHTEVTGDPGCACDPDRIAHVLSNLVGNAIQHGSDARAIRVRLDGTGADVVRVTVSNPGTIPAELSPTLFNPFRRVRGDVARDRGHGLGLGLYIARRVVVGHGGEITMVTGDGDGTTFCVALPRIATAAAFSLTPEQGDEEAISLQRLGIPDPHSRVTASLFGVLPLHERAPDAFGSLVERHGRLLELSLDRQIYRGVGTNLASDLRDLAEHLGTMGGGANDVAELHSRALQVALKGASALKAQNLVTEGRLLALELMGRLLTFYRKRSGFGALAGRPAERGE